MRVYYLNAEYETGKHKILKVWSSYVSISMPEDFPNRQINVPYSTIEFDEAYNRALARNLLMNHRTTPMGELPDRFYINNSGQLIDNDTQEVVTINPNPQKEAYKLSQLYGLTQSELATYIDNQMASISNLAQTKTIIGELLKKMASVELYLVKQSKLDE